MRNFNLFLRKISLAKTMALFITVFALFGAAVVFFVSRYYITENVINHYLEEYLTYQHTDFSNAVNETIRQLNTFTISLTTDQNIYRIVNSSSLSDEEKRTEIEKLLNHFLANVNIIENISIVTRKGEIYSHSTKGRSFPVPDASFIKSQQSGKLFCLDKIIRDEENSPYIIFGKSMRNYNTGVSIGHIFLYVKESYIRSAYRSTSFENSTTFVTMGNCVISHSDNEKIGSYFYMPNIDTMDNPIYAYNNDYVIDIHRFSSSPLPEWAMVSIIPKKSLYSLVRNYTLTLQLMIILLFFTCILFSAFVARKITSPVKKLKNNIEDFAKGKNIKFNLSQENEIIALSRSFHIMTEEIEQLMQKNIAEKEKQRIAELQALQSQIKPHFIYNVLDTTAWMAKVKNQFEIEEMLHSLAMFFRMSLHNGDNIITIEEEILHVENYIMLEQRRFPGHFNVSWEISPDILKYKTPKIILQPIVENAIKHGFGNTNSGNNLIQIIGFEMDENIYFEIRDNGCGMETDPISNIKQEKSKGYGIYNVQQRLILEYGEGYGLSYKTRVGAGTSVSVKIKKTI